MVEVHLPRIEAGFTIRTLSFLCSIDNSGHPSVVVMGLSQIVRFIFLVVMLRVESMALLTSVVQTIFSSRIPSKIRQRFRFMTPTISLHATKDTNKLVAAFPAGLEPALTAS